MSVRRFTLSSEHLRLENGKLLQQSIPTVASMATANPNYFLFVVVATAVTDVVVHTVDPVLNIQPHVKSASR